MQALVRGNKKEPEARKRYHKKQQRKCLKKSFDKGLKKLKKYLLSYLLEMIRTTLFRQTQFAEFEDFAHAMVEKGEPLTKENSDTQSTDVDYIALFEILVANAEK